MRHAKIAALFFACSASLAAAADILPRKPSNASSLGFTWTGFTVGLTAGGFWSDNTKLNAQTWNLYQPTFTDNALSAALLTGTNSTTAQSGFLGGGQIGYNQQIGNSRDVGIGTGFVSGIEADIQGIASSGGNSLRSVTGNVTQVFFGVPVNFQNTTYQTGKSNLEYLGTVRGRLGILATPLILIYGTGGLAYGGSTASIQNFQSVNVSALGETHPAYSVLGYGSYSNIMVGWTAGGGAEWMFLPHWSAKAEYLYYNLGKASSSVINITAFNAGQAAIQSVTNFSTHPSGNLLRAGINYHFSLETTGTAVNY